MSPREKKIKPILVVELEASGGYFSKLVDTKYMPGPKDIDAFLIFQIQNQQKKKRVVGLFLDKKTGFYLKEL